VIRRISTAIIHPAFAVGSRQQRMIVYLPTNLNIFWWFFERTIDWIQGWSKDLETHRPKLPGSPANQNNVEHQRRKIRFIKYHILTSRHCTDNIKVFTFDILISRYCNTILYSISNKRIHIACTKRVVIVLEYRTRYRRVFFDIDAISSIQRGFFFWSVLNIVPDIVYDIVYEIWSLVPKQEQVFHVDW
jgi:hypothetical protein